MHENGEIANEDTANNDVRMSNCPWLITLYSGERFWMKELTNHGQNRKLIHSCKTSSIHVLRSHDPATNKTLLTRHWDGMVRIETEKDDNNALIVQHADGTRQTRFIINKVNYVVFC